MASRLCISLQNRFVDLYIVISWLFFGVHWLRCVLLVLLLFSVILCAKIQFYSFNVRLFFRTFAERTASLFHISLSIFVAQDFGLDFPFFFLFVQVLALSFVGNVNLIHGRTFTTQKRKVFAMRWLMCSEKRARFESGFFKVIINWERQRRAISNWAKWIYFCHMIWMTAQEALCSDATRKM